MNLAVKLFGDVDEADKPAGIPDSWPAEVKELGVSTTLPEGQWTLYTNETLATYRASVLSEYQTWASGLALLAAKRNKIARLQDDANVFLESKYVLLTRMQLMNLYTLAKFDGLDNRAAYIRTGIDWMNGVSSYVLTVATEISSKATVNQVLSVGWDIETNSGVNPAITLLAALAIMD